MAVVRPFGYRDLIRPASLPFYRGYSIKRGAALLGFFHLKHNAQEIGQSLCSAIKQVTIDLTRQSAGDKHGIGKSSRQSRDKIKPRSEYRRIHLHSGAGTQRT